ncbi:MAG: hypothetical protein M1825_001993 [Sarcosagium campestre]|nr:MAG: hypothetical protein M1825_001993 [Sarcosagium campestre]
MPRLTVRYSASQLCRPSSQSSYLPFLLPYFHQRRSASILGALSDNPASYNKRIRRGRGPSSGKGKTSGRGHNGQKKHGQVPEGFEGGQTPLTVTQGNRGFENVFSQDMSPLNLDRLQDWIDQGRLDPSKPITMKELAESRCLHGVKDGVKVLGRGADKLRSPIQLLVSRASASAIAAIEATGGSVLTRYYTPFSIRQVLRGNCDSGASMLSPIAAAEEIEHFKYRLPDPIARKSIEYYRDRAHRGYLSQSVPWNEGPSLFFKPPGIRDGKKKTSTVKKDAAARAENRLW